MARSIDDLDFDAPIERANINTWDWEHAERYCRTYLRRKLFESAKTYEDDARAYTTAIVVTYSRPFSGNRRRDGRRDALDSQYITVLDPSQRGLHERVVGLRDTTFAHSDASTHDVKITDTPGGGMSMLSDDPLLPLERTEVEGILVNIARFKEINQQLLAKAVAARRAGRGELDAV